MSRTLPTRRAAAPPARAGPASTQELGRAPTVGENHREALMTFRESGTATSLFFLLSCVFLHFQVQCEVWVPLPTSTVLRRTEKLVCDSFLSPHPVVLCSVFKSRLTYLPGSERCAFSKLGLCPKRILSVLWFFFKRTLLCLSPGKAAHLGTGYRGKLTGAPGLPPVAASICRAGIGLVLGGQVGRGLFSNPR